MVRSVNAEFMAKVPDTSPRREVGCITCHRAGEKPPRQLDEIVLTEVTAKGVAAGLRVHEQYRTDFLGSGLYDFRERTLNIVGTSLREQKRNDDAAAIFKANLERFPNSGVALVTLGQIAAEGRPGRGGDLVLTRRHGRPGERLRASTPREAQGVGAQAAAIGGQAGGSSRHWAAVPTGYLLDSVN
jgi:hypothetical protein